MTQLGFCYWIFERDGVCFVCSPAHSFSNYEGELVVKDSVFYLKSVFILQCSLPFCLCTLSNAYFMERIPMLKCDSGSSLYIDKFL